MGLAISASKIPLPVDEHRRIVNADSIALVEACDDPELVSPRGLAQRLRRRTGDRFGGLVDLQARADAVDRLAQTHDVGSGAPGEIDLLCIECHVLCRIALSRRNETRRAD